MVDTRLVGMKAESLACSVSSPRSLLPGGCSLRCEQARPRRTRYFTVKSTSHHETVSSSKSFFPEVGHKGRGNKYRKLVPGVGYFCDKPDHTLLRKMWILKSSGML